MYKNLTIPYLTYFQKTWKDFSMKNTFLWKRLFYEKDFSMKKFASLQYSRILLCFASAGRFASRQYSCQFAVLIKVGVFLVWHKRPQIWNGSWPSSSGLRGHKRTYLTILKRAWSAHLGSANFKMVWYVLLLPLRPELDGQDPFQIFGRLCQTRKTPTLV
jgi:hypothetical protein